MLPGRRSGAAHSALRRALFDRECRSARADVPPYALSESHTPEAKRADVCLLAAPETILNWLTLVEKFRVFDVIPGFDRRQRLMVRHVAAQRRHRDVTLGNGVIV